MSNLDKAAGVVAAIGALGAATVIIMGTLLGTLTGPKKEKEKGK